MKLNDLNEPAKYKFFLDMDGVIADFDKGVGIILGVPRDSLTTNQMWRKLDPMLVAGKPVYNTFPMMSDAKVLWNYVIKYGKPTILTSTGHKHPEIIAEQKKEWINKHFPYNLEIITVEHSHLKAEYAAPNHILIDDRAKSIDPWKEKGGIGILHTSANETIRELMIIEGAARK